MNLIHIFKQGVMCVTLAGLSMVMVTGCADSRELKACQLENESLALQLAEMQTQLQQADSPSPAVAAAPSTYLVVQGDSLWSIAARQLGDGKRYKEILALNPGLTQDTPLKIGSTLTLPPR